MTKMISTTTTKKTTTPYGLTEMKKKNEALTHDKMMMKLIVRKNMAAFGRFDFYKLQTHTSSSTTSTATKPTTRRTRQTTIKASGMMS